MGYEFGHSFVVVNLYFIYFDVLLLTGYSHFSDFISESFCSFLEIYKNAAFVIIPRPIIIADDTNNGIAIYANDTASSKSELIMLKNATSAQIMDTAIITAPDTLNKVPILLDSFIIICINS